VWGDLRVKKIPVTSWLLIAFVAIAVAACSNGSVTSLPVATGAVVTSSTAAGCATKAVQPSWIFLGTCRTIGVPRAGVTVPLTAYKGYTVSLGIPKNHIGTPAVAADTAMQITVVDATGKGDVKANHGKAFPLNGKAFLYVQTVGHTKPILFARNAAMMLTVRATQDFAATTCSVAMLTGVGPNAAWKTLAKTKLNKKSAGVSFTIPPALLDRIALGAVYYSVTCASTPLPAYCSSYSLPTPAGSVPLNVTDDSGIGGVLLVYITNGTDFMDDNGNFDDNSANPIAAACFPGSSGATSTIDLPANVSGGRIYFAYGTPVPSQPNTVPNPMSGVSVSGPSFGYNQSAYPYDKIEYGTQANALIDTTQVDALGLPLELSVTSSLPPESRRTRAMSVRLRADAMPTPCATSAPSTVGVTSCNYANIYSVLGGLAPYSRTIYVQKFNGNGPYDRQIVNPQNASPLGFPDNLFAMNKYAPETSSPCTSVNWSTATDGYLTCVMTSYKTTARLYESSEVAGVIGTSGDNYCASSDGSTKFTFTDVGSAASCASPSPTPKPSSTTIDMSVQEFTYGELTPNDGCTTNLLFGLPWGNAQVGASQIFTTPDGFAMWKALGVDLNRGVALATTTYHPVGGSSPTMSDFFKDPLENEYAYVIHYYFDQNLAYALAFDDSGNFESGVTWETGDPINVRINAIPTASSVLPAAAPTPYPVPSPCPVLPTVN
jgi:hypothetical protein